MQTTQDRLAQALTARYQVDRELGAGGMATVYKAHDQKHDRDVAIKVLHPDLGAALGADRFIAEIRTLANLQHPHILPLLDSGEADGLLYYVMPLVTGETLRAKLDRERQLSIPEATRIARDVASALDYAHRHDVIHRDIKPENILLHDGSALVADFGIALALQQAGGQRITQTGLSLGTPQYMSPEQAMGEKTIDARSDVYALGAMTYEMLTGEPPFTGPTVQAIIAKVLATEPADITTLRKSVPENIAAAVHSALEKLPADRCESAKAFSEMLANTHTGHHASPAHTVRHPSRRASNNASLALGAIALLALASTAWMWQRSRNVAPEPVVQLMLDTPAGAPILAKFAVSGDGTRFAFSTGEGIAYRDAGQREFRLLTGTVNAESPSFSPDGDWIAYEANGQLRKIPVAGGAPVALIPNDTLLASSVAWGEDGSIVFETSAGFGLISPDGTLRVMKRVAAAAKPRTTPDGRGVLYLDNRHNAKLMYYDLAMDTAFTLLEDAASAQLLPTGRLIYGLPSGGLYTIGLNKSRHAVEGTPSPVVLDMQPNGGVSPFVVTKNGTLVYRAGVDAQYRTLIRQPNGKVDTLPIAPKVLSYARFSPDGRSLAITIGASRGTDRAISIYNFAAGSLTAFTVEGGGHSPIWSPDGKRMVFTAESQTSDAEDLFVQPLDRSAPPLSIVRAPSDQHATAWPSDTQVVFSNNAAANTITGGTVTLGNANTEIVNPTGTSPVRPYLHAQWSEHDVSISPDGQWAAFTSLESGAPEINVRRFPVAESGGQWKVSTGGGQRSRWSGDGRTIYYQSADNSAIHAVHVTAGAPFVVGRDETIMRVPHMGTAWDVDRTTGRILVTEPVVAAGTRMVVIQHWLR